MIAVATIFGMNIHYRGHPRRPRWKSHDMVDIINAVPYSMVVLSHWESVDTAAADGSNDVSLNFLKSPNH